MGTTPPPLKLISEGGTTTHYQNPLSRHYLRPFCNMSGWRDKAWQLDDGVGAELCRRCMKCQAARLESYRLRVNAQQRKNYHKDPDKKKQAVRVYYHQNPQVAIVKKRLRRQRRREMGLPVT